MNTLSGEEKKNPRENTPRKIFFPLLSVVEIAKLKWIFALERRRSDLNAEMDDEFNPKIVKVFSLADVPFSSLPQSPTTLNDSMDDGFSYDLKTRRRSLPRDHRQSPGAAKRHGRSRRRFSPFTQMGRRRSSRPASSASPSASVKCGENSLQHGIALILTGLMKLINTSYAKEKVPAFNDALDWFISVLLKNRVFLSDDQRSSQDAIEQLVTDLTDHLPLSDSAETASSTASTPSSTAPRPRRSRRASKAATAPTLSAALTGVSSLEKRKEEAAKQMKRLRIGGCYGCLLGHKFANFETCIPFCVFCELTFDNGSPRHFPMECDQRPALRGSIIDAIKCAKRTTSALVTGVSE